MNQEVFFLTFNGRSYPCKPIGKSGRILYQIKFNNSYLYLTQARDFDGNEFWTAIPQDSKLKHVVQELGKKIETHLIENVCATTTGEK